MSHATVLVAVEGPHEKVADQIAWEMEPFDEAGDWFSDGSRWDWYQVGGRWAGMLGTADILQVKNFSIDTAKSVQEKWLREAYADHLKNPGSPFSSVQNGESQEDFLRRRLDAYHYANHAFLKNRHWHEADRLGWFGATAYTECERKDLDKPVADPDKWFGKCLYRMKEKQAQIVCWNEPTEIWQENFVHRFVEPLGPEAYLALVDYHV